ncbi:hypothetical protein ACSBR2_028407 [Camellia fascicularis]
MEDTFYEDPDDIPTIKLNIEQFTQNLCKRTWNYVRDMSKALVALNTEAASIPTPKLKNVSRLRTEHQVYELPDSHPLLKGVSYLCCCFISFFYQQHRLLPTDPLKYSAG